MNSQFLDEVIVHKCSIREQVTLQQYNVLLDGRISAHHCSAWTKIKSSQKYTI